MTGAISRVKQLSPKRFSWIVDDLDAANVDGFLAHEAQTVVPEAVHGTHNQVDDEGEPVYQGIDQAKLVPLDRSPEESIAKIEALEARVTALEGITCPHGTLKADTLTHSTAGSLTTNYVVEVVRRRGLLLIKSHLP